MISEITKISLFFAISYVLFMQHELKITLLYPLLTITIILSVVIYRFNNTMAALGICLALSLIIRCSSKATVLPWK